MTKHIPNFITCLNLICGCLGSIAIMQDKPNYASYLIILALIFDFFDGYAARTLKVASPIGKELDSLADVVTFGLLPGLLMFWLLNNGLSGLDLSHFIKTGLPFLGFSLTVFSALRLAKFNVDTRQTDSFIGVPTPANALLIGSIAIVNQDNLVYGITSSLIFQVATTIIMSWLLVSPLRLFALKFKSYGWNENRYQYLFLILSLAVFLVLKFGAMPIVIILYITLSLLADKKEKSANRHMNSSRKK